MTVKEVVALAAENLGREDLSAALEALEGEPQGELKSLLRCYNLVENEVALDYCPLKSEETFVRENGVLSYSEFAHAPVDICAVRGKDGNPLPFTIRPACLSLPQGAGEVTVTYAYAPEKKSYGEDSAFSGKISARLLALGVACEYCLSCARYSEAAAWEKRFRDALRATELIRRKLCVRSRRWV